MKISCKKHEGNIGGACSLNNRSSWLYMQYLMCCFVSYATRWTKHKTNDALRDWKRGAENKGKNRPSKKYMFGKKYRHLNCDDIYTSFSFRKHTQILIRVHWRFAITYKLQWCNFSVFFFEFSTLFIIDFKCFSKRIFNETKCRQPFHECVNQIVLRTHTKKQMIKTPNDR